MNELLLKVGKESGKLNGYRSEVNKIEVNLSNWKFDY